MSGGRLFSIIGLAISIAFALPASALASDTVIEAENMTWPAGTGDFYGGSSTRQDSSNPSVAGYYLWNNQTGSAGVTTAKPLTGLSVRLRSDQFGSLCQGSPQVAVKVDGVTRLSATVAPSTAYSQPLIDVGAPLASFSVPPGSHTIAVALLNDHDSSTFPCDRNLWIDKVTLVASSIFSDTSYRNQPLAANAALDADQTFAAGFKSQVEQFGTYVNTNVWSVPVYTVGAGQARVNVQQDPRWQSYWGSDATAWTSDFGSVPLPSNAKAAGPSDGTSDGEVMADVSWSDREISIWQPSTDTIWELYHLVKHLGNWSATNGGKITGVSGKSNYDPWPSGRDHGVAATRIPLLGGLQRISELQNGAINHVVSVTIPHAMEQTLRGAIRAPALASDGDWSGADAVPEGTRFRLPASLNIDALPLTPYARTVAHAIQSYGMVVTDKDCWTQQLPAGAKCSSVTFSAEDPTPLGGTNPYAQIFGGVPEWHLFDNFPWDQLQVLPQTQ
jgi:hypothetical protein